MITNKL